VAAERVFVPTREGVVALDPTTGKTKWRRSSADNLYGLAGDVLLAGDLARVLALDHASGETRWTFEPPGEHAHVARTVAVHAGTVYVAAVTAPGVEVEVENPYERFYGLDLGTGERTFVRDLRPSGMKGSGDLGYVVVGDAGAFVTLGSGGLLGTDLDGTVRWRRHERDWDYPPVLDDGVVVQPTGRSVVGVDARDGKTRWRNFRVKSDVADAGGIVYGAGGGRGGGRGGGYPDKPGRLVALDPANGQSQWTARVHGCGGRPAVGSGFVAVPVGCRDGNGRTTLFGVDTGCRYGTIPGKASAAIRDDRLYASFEHEGRLAAYALP